MLICRPIFDYGDRCTLRGHSREREDFTNFGWECSLRRLFAEERRFAYLPEFLRARLRSYLSVSAT